MKKKKSDEMNKKKAGSQDAADLRKRVESKGKVALKALWLSEEKSSYAFRSASYAITITQASDGKIIEVNDGFFAITGYNFKDIAGKTTVELNLWDNESDRNLVVSELSKGKKIAGLEFSFRKKSGERIVGLFSAEIIIIQNEKCLFSSITDITERKRAEEALRDSEERYRTLFNEALDGTCLADAETGLIIDCNQALADLVGRERAELIGQSQKILHPPYANQADYSLTFRQHLTDKEGQILETQVVTRAGIIREVEIKANRLNLQGRKMLQGIFRDITERKRAESQREAVLDALQESEEKYRVLFESINDAVFVHDLNEEGLPGRFLQVNDIACRRLGYTRKELLSLTPRDITIPEEYERIADKRIGLASQGDILVETIHVTKDGLKIPVESNIHQFQYLDRQVALSISRDITERKRAASQMEAALEAVRQKAKELQEKNVELECFTYSVSHDLKSPLVTIRTFLGILEQDMAAMDKGKVKQDIGYIRSGAEKMSKLLDELLDLSRIGHSPNPPEEISLQSIVKEASGLVAGRITERKVNVKVTEEPIVLTGDRVRLVEVFQNLLENACKFMGEQKSPLIEIGVETKDDETVIFVRDNGSGITPQFQPKLFIMFEKQNRSSEGDGIGLALVKRIVEVHGGRIWAESEGSGQGTTFYFTLAKTCLQKTKENQ